MGMFLAASVVACVIRESAVLIHRAYANCNRSIVLQAGRVFTDVPDTIELDQRPVFCTGPPYFCIPGAEECSLAFHEGRPLSALTWVAQQPRQGAARSRADEEADQLAEVAAAYADRCEHVLGSSDRAPGANGAAGAGLGSRSSEYGSQADDGFSLLQVCLYPA